MEIHSAKAEQKFGKVDNEVIVLVLLPVLAMTIRQPIKVLYSLISVPERKERRQIEVTLSKVLNRRQAPVGNSSIMKLLSQIHAQEPCRFAATISCE